MKITLLALVSLAALTSTAFAGQAQYGNGVYSPDVGVICDSMGKWCADGTGISASWTSQFFGPEMASKLDGVDQSNFGYSNKVKCSVPEQSCTGGGAAREMTAMLFGKAAATGGAAGVAAKLDFGSGVYSPEKGVICDTTGQWCADGTGLSASWTEQYFGGEAAGKLSGATQDEFGFSNKVECATATRSCTGGSGKAAKKMAKTLFRQ